MVKQLPTKKNFVSTTYGNEDNISKKINSPHFKDLEYNSLPLVETSFDDC